MSEETELLTDEISGLDKLPPQKKFLVEQVFQNLKTGGKVWRAGWKMPEVPVSAITGKKYNGSNRLYLSLVATARGYSDNRYATYKQMEERGWTFKTDDEGNSLGKGAGVPVEYYMEYDKQTKKRFDENTLAGMTDDEKEEYKDKNVVWVSRYYYVFNGDLIDGIPEKEKIAVSSGGYSERAEQLIKTWSENEVPVIYGGSSAYYSIDKEEIHIPSKELFESAAERQGTTLHEITHSTGAEKRLKRRLTGDFASEDYAKEELVAEFGAMFLMQETGVVTDNDKFENNSAYIQSWIQNIKDKPNELFYAIHRADIATQYVLHKEKEHSIEPYAVVETVNDYGDKVYNLFMIGNYGNVTKFMGYDFPTREELMTEFEKMRKLPFYAGRDFRETTLDDLKVKSVERYESEEKKKENEVIDLDDIKEEESEVFKPPQVAARAVPQESRPVDMTERGIEKLTRLSDREVVEQAKATKDGSKFMSLYNGVNLADSEVKNEQMLMNRLAMFCDGDKERLMRVFKTSGQYRDEKPNAYYERMADKSMGLIASIKAKITPPVISSSVSPVRANASFKA